MKIEAGCLVMIVKSFYGYEGKIVTVVKFVEDITTPILGITRGWHVEPHFEHRNKHKRIVCTEDQLMRIDGFKSEITELHKELVY